jgi:hypothetical protein
MLSRPDLLRQSSTSILDHWTDPVDSDLPEEYQKIVDKMIITGKVMGTSSQSKTVERLDSFCNSFNRGRGLTCTFNDTMTLAIRAAFNLTTNTNVDTFTTSFPALDVYNGNVFGGAISLYAGLAKWRKRYIHSAIAYLTVSFKEKQLDRVSFQMLLGLMVRGASECESRKCWVFSEILNACDGFTVRNNNSGETKTTTPTTTPTTTSTTSTMTTTTTVATTTTATTTTTTTTTTTSEDAKESLFAALSDNIDQMKLRAFDLVFIQPTIEYYTMIGDYTMAGDVNVHGGNAYLAILMATLGVRLNRLPMLHDPEVKGVVDFLSAGGTFNSIYLRELWSTQNFDRGCAKKQTNISSRQMKNRFIFGPASTPVHLANLCLESSGGSKAKRVRLSVYLSAFSKYFQEDFIVERLIGYVLQNNELKTFADLYVHQDFAQYVYDDLDEIVPKFSKERAKEFLMNIGIAKVKK